MIKTWQPLKSQIPLTYNDNEGYSSWLAEIGQCLLWGSATLTHALIFLALSKYLCSLKKHKSVKCRTKAFWLSAGADTATWSRTEQNKLFAGGRQRAESGDWVRTKFRWRMLHLSSAPPGLGNLAYKAKAGILEVLAASPHTTTWVHTSLPTWFSSISLFRCSKKISPPWYREMQVSETWLASFPQGL